MTRPFTGSIPKLAPVPKEPKRLRPRSTKTADRDAQYAIERVEFLAEHPTCEARWTEECATTTAPATDVHHMGGRLPSVFFRKSWWLATCSPCHHEITTNPDEAIERGLSVRRNRVEENER